MILRYTIYPPEIAALLDPATLSISKDSLAEGGFSPDEAYILRGVGIFFVTENLGIGYIKEHKLEHLELYNIILGKENIEKSKMIVSMYLHEMGYEPVKVERARKNGLPFLLCEIRTEEAFDAQMIGLFAEITSIFPEYEEPFFYLPVVVVCCDYNDRIKPYIDRGISIAHELQHLSDMIELIKRCPDYPHQLYRYGLNRIMTIQDLPRSIDLEISKLFHIEPVAMKCDFDKGQKSLFFPLDEDAKRVVRYDCDTRYEYVGLHILSYLSRIKSAYESKFDNDEEASKIIHKELDKALKRYGTNVFGPDPNNGLSQLKEQASKRFMTAILRGQFV